MIHDSIEKSVCDFKIKTGEYPNSIYLGQAEIERLMRWAVENDYASATDTKITGESRPEIMGIPVYVVNTASHFAVA